MNKWIRGLTPETFKNRILMAFLLLVLAPFVLLVIYNFSETERVLQEEASAKNEDQLLDIEKSFLDVLGLVMKTGLLLEQDDTIRSVMKNPEQKDPLTRKELVENKFASIENSFFLTGATVYYTLVDKQGYAYTSFAPREPLNYSSITNEAWVKMLSSNEGESSIWNASDTNYVSSVIKPNQNMLSLYQMLRDENLKEYAYARISIDYEQWFNKVMRDRQREGIYYLLDHTGKSMVQSDADEAIDPAILSAMLEVKEPSASASIVSQDEKVLYTFSRIAQLNGFIVKKVPLSLLFEEVETLKKRFFAIFGLITLVFVMMTYFISSTITVPLKTLQRKMEISVKTNLKVKLPEQGRGEILALTRSFNTMIDDINGLMERLQLEERQRQVVRFQVLLSQMNPHFLLNTLNVIKSIALEKDEDDIYEICVSLGKILETTLNVEVDLILLKDEIALIDSYMRIQSARFGGHITVSYELSDELNFALVPKFCLQPLVENAIIHGFGGRRSDGRIEIKAEARHDLLYLEVADNGVGVERAKEKKVFRKRKSIGIQNIRESLELLFKNQSTGLSLASSEEGTKVMMHLPLLLSKPYLKEADSDVDRIDR
ncbi:histidine kinase [Paenibacillus sp. FSL A5-0031]|uniref:sensor histidine kinase n=1 Tax=Paenibacillus sp. FSL A5-0031 TaxID=1920420 RepID=UPI002116D813|nr:histidine kinase [Paenibacillus sp. FSL A5-0031]